jgi:hypothetical protein
MEKFLSIPIAMGGHKLISANDICTIEDNQDESCVYVMYKNAQSIVKIYYMQQATEAIPGDEVKNLDSVAEPGKAFDGDKEYVLTISEAIENAVIDALQKNPNQVVHTIHELPLEIFEVVSYQFEQILNKYNDGGALYPGDQGTLTPGEAAVQA